MKTLRLVILFGLILTITSIFSQPQPQQLSPEQQHMLALAREGCQKPLGYFPTPSKLMCVLTAVGKSQKEVKAKSLAIIFSVCRGQGFQTNVTYKKYDTLANCLKDPAAITLINKELTAEGFPAVKIVNPSILSPS